MIRRAAFLLGILAAVALSSAPASGQYGPEKNRDIKIERATVVDIQIPEGKQVVFTFYNKPGTAESAFMIYRLLGPDLKSGLELVHEAGSPPYRGWDDYHLTQSGQYLLTAWAKVRFWARDLRTNDRYVKAERWAQSCVEQRPPTAPYFLRFVSDDMGNNANEYDSDWNNGHDWSWDDVTGWASLVDK